MPELKERPESKVTVEDLLKFKRQETPGDGFWDSFDCSIQKKTIQALVNEKPKHRRWGPYMIKWSLAVVPAAGAAAFSLSVFVNRVPVPGIAVASADNSAAQAEVADTVAVAEKQDKKLFSGEEFKTIANHASYVMDVLSPYDGQVHYKTIQTAQNLTVEAPAHTRYAASTIKPSGLSSVLASVPSFDHF